MGSKVVPDRAAGAKLGAASRDWPAGAQGPLYLFNIIINQNKVLLVMLLIKAIVKKF